MFFRKKYLSKIFLWKRRSHESPPHNTTACKVLYFKVNIKFQYFQIHLDGSTRHVHKCNQQLRDLQRLIKTKYHVVKVLIPDVISKLLLVKCKILIAIQSKQLSHVRSTVVNVILTVILMLRRSLTPVLRVAKHLLLKAS